MTTQFPVRSAVMAFFIAMVVGYLFSVVGLGLVVVAGGALVIVVAYLAILRDLSHIPVGAGPYGGWPNAEIGSVPDDVLAIPVDQLDHVPALD